MHLPPGYTHIVPYLLVKNGDLYLTFLHAAFGAETMGITRDSAGILRNARVRIGDGMMMVSEPGKDIGATFGTHILYVADADAATDRAVAAGATLMFPPQDMEYGDRQSGVTDPAGNIWWITQRLTAAPYDDFDGKE